MTIYYKNQGFYINGVHNFIPENAVAISEDDYHVLLKGQADGKQIISNKDGYPVLVEQQPSPYHHFADGKWQLSADNQAKLLAEQRQTMRDKINALRDEKINGGVYVEAIDKWIDTDAVAERNILSVKATFDLFGEQEIPWTFADNSVVVIDKEKLLQIWQAVMQAKTGNHANALKHKAMMEQSDNPLEYDYSDGWTKTYQE